MTLHPETDVESLPLDADVRVDEACLRFEAVWKTGGRPSIEDFMRDANGVERLVLLRELIVLDVCYRRRLNEAPVARDYLQRFPELDVAWTARRITASDGEETPFGPGGTATFTADRTRISKSIDRDWAGSFDDYDRLERIGQGGMGVVYKARQIQLNRTVALKMIRDGDFAGVGDLERFRTEAEVVARIHHPNIVQIHEVGLHRGRQFISLEFCGGGNLKEKLNGAPMPPRNAALLLETLARAMQAAHSHHVIHRDLKPANILLTADGTPKVTDFGLAKKLDEAGQTQTGAVMGTPSYMAPEQAIGHGKTVGAAADIYALGAILYECLTGRPPFNAATTLETIAQVITDEPVPPTRLNAKAPRDLETICLKCLQKDPYKRYVTALQLAEDLQRFQAGESIIARPSGMLERTAKWVRRRPALAGLLVVAGLTLSALAGGWLWFTLQLRGERDRARAAETQARNERDAALEANRRRVRAQIEQLCLVPPEAALAILAALKDESDDVLPHLRDRWADRAGDHKQRMRAGLALLEAEPDLVRDELAAWMLVAEAPAEVLLFRDALAPHADDLRESIWSRADDTKASAATRFRALAAAAAFDPRSDRWEKRAESAVRQLLSENALHLGIWVKGFRPISYQLLKPLAAMFRSAPSPERREMAALVLADFAAGYGIFLADLLADADARQFAILFPKLSTQPDAVETLKWELRRETPRDAKEAERVALASRQANAAVALLRLGQEELVWPLLRFVDDPTLRSYLVQRLSALGVEADRVVRRLDEEPDVTARRALIIALGEYTAEQLPPTLREPLTKKLLEWYRSDPDRGIHGAIDWLLRHAKEGNEPRKLDWKQAAELRKIDEELKGVAPVAEQRWRVNPSGITVSIFPGPIVARMGSPNHEQGRFEYEIPHERGFKRGFALATKTITVAQWQQFLKEHPEIKHFYTKKYSPAANGPIVAVTWFEAAQFCRWLSDTEGIDPDQMCYPPVAEIEKCKDGSKSLKLPANYLSRTGYRLPTEAEWEYACRAETTTSRYYGGGEELLPRYAWFTFNMPDRAFPVGQKRPNDFGLFDMHGNVWTWCQEGGGAYEPGKDGSAIDDKEDRREITIRLDRVLRGGSFYNLPVVIRSAYRYGNLPTFRNDMVGLRIARTVWDDAR